MPELPPLNAVRAFEAAARHVSFSKAADELCVTRGAISRQVALLESWLGQALFVRSSSQLQLTNAGHNYLTEVSAALTRLAFASEYLSDQAGSVVIRLNAPPTFTMQWLIRRMSSFQKRYPNIDLRVTTYRPTDHIREEEFDVGIRGRREPLAGMVSRPFLNENIIPVCHPDLLGDRTQLDVADIEKHTLITYNTETYTWPQWLEALGHAPITPARIMRFDPMYFALQAAQEGLGLVLLPLFVVIDDLITGRLCAPFGIEGESQRKYYVSSSPNSHVTDAINVFSDWLVEEGTATHHIIAEWMAQQGSASKASPPLIRTPARFSGG
jgi:LysR family glycine cleavage system transcriptional activator